jgi:hypothetical protein
MRGRISLPGTLARIAPRTAFARRLVIVAALALLGALLLASSALADGTTLQIVSGGSTSLAGSSRPAGDGTGQQFDLGLLQADEDDGEEGTLDVVNRTIAPEFSNGKSVSAGKKAKSNPELGASFEGLNFYQQRFANNGNNISVEPPDQALCVGNGYVVEGVNDAINVYDSSGNSVLPANGVGGAVDLNTFFGYPPAFDRAAGTIGPTLTDPSCYFDRATQRFFFVILTLDHVGTTVDLSGTNHLDIAVSNTPDPTGSWTIYKIPVQNNGTDGTPDHHCSSGFCLGDFPHLGADRNGIYLTTNEFAFFGPGFFGAQIYAISKAALASGAPSIPVVLFNTLGYGPDGGAFTVWPATTPGDQYSDDAGGTEYLMSSRAVFSPTGTSTQLLTWALSNTSSLNTATPALSLNLTPVDVDQYGIGRRPNQKVGNSPLAQCLEDPACRPFTGLGAFQTANKNVDRSTFGVLAVSYANGKLWATLETSATVDDVPVEGVGWYVIKPRNNAGLATSLSKQGILALADTNLTFPTLAVTSSGRGVLGFTIVGPDDYPGAGYAGLDANVGAGDVHIAAAGQDAEDGFLEYRLPRRPRWGDYAAAVADGSTIWLGNEYIAHSCTYAQYFTPSPADLPQFTCARTRGLSGNWSTRVSKLTP